MRGMVRSKGRENPLDVSIKVISSLASDDSIRIFLACEEGIDSSAKAIEELGMTEKRYYTWLRKLLDAGLVEKRRNTYVQTMLGKFYHMLWDSFLNILSQRNHLELADKVMNIDKLSMTEKEKFLRVISNNELVGTASLVDVLHEVKMIVDYDHLIAEVVKLLDNAEESVYMAVNRFDNRVMEASLKAIDKGLKFFFLSSEEKGFPESMEALRMLLLHSDVVKIIQRLLNSKELNVRSMKEHLSHSFIIIDGKYGIIELPHPLFHDFYVAFKFRNAFFCQKLIKTFNSLYEQGKEDSRIAFARRFLSSRK